MWNTSIKYTCSYQLKQELFCVIVLTRSSNERLGEVVTIYGVHEKRFCKVYITKKATRIQTIAQS